MTSYPASPSKSHFNPSTWATSRQPLSRATCLLAASRPDSSRTLQAALPRCLEETNDSAKSTQPPGARVPTSRFVLVQNQRARFAESCMSVSRHSPVGRPTRAPASSMRCSLQCTRARGDGFNSAQRLSVHSPAHISRHRRFAETVCRHRVTESSVSWCQCWEPT